MELPEWVQSPKLLIVTIIKTNQSISNSDTQLNLYLVTIEARAEEPFREHEIAESIVRLALQALHMKTFPQIDETMDSFQIDFFQLFREHVEYLSYPSKTSHKDFHPLGENQPH